MSISCLCDVEKDGYIDQEIKHRERNKVLNVFRVGQEHGLPTLKFQVRYQRCTDLAFEFGLGDITRVINQNMANGILTLMLSMKR
jgi:hypothetical protein